MKFRTCAVIGVSLALITTSAFGNVPKSQKSSFQGVEHIKKDEPIVKLKPDERIILKQKGEHSLKIITNMREILILTGSVKGVLEKTASVKAYTTSEDGRYIFTIRKNGMMKVFDRKNKTEYEYEDAAVTDATVGDKFTSGSCGDWTYFISTDKYDIVLVRMKGKKLHFFADKLLNTENKNVEIIQNGDCLEVYLDGEKAKVINTPK